MRQRREWFEGQESNHSPQNLQAQDEETGRPNITEVGEEVRHQVKAETSQVTIHVLNKSISEAWKDQVQWPAMEEKRERETFDHDLDQMLAVASVGDVDRSSRLCLQ